MITRVCPFCKKVLCTFEHYFCSTCGKKLPENLIHPVEIAKADKVVPVAALKPKLTLNLKGIDKKKLMGGGLLLVGLAVILLIFLNVIPRIPDLFGTSTEVAEGLQAENLSEENLQKILASNKDFKAGVFGSEDFAKVVPFEVDLYMEVADLKWLFLNTSFFGEELVSIAEEQYDSPLCVFALENDGNILWAFMFNASDQLTLEEVTALIPSDHWEYKVISDKVVFASDAKVFAMVAASTEGVTKSVSMSPFYARAIATTSKEGQALVMVSGYKGKKILENVLSMREWEKLMPLIDEMLNLGYNEVVVR